MHYFGATPTGMIYRQSVSSPPTILNSRSWTLTRSTTMMPRTILVDGGRGVRRLAVRGSPPTPHPARRHGPGLLPPTDGYRHLQGAGVERVRRAMAKFTGHPDSEKNTFTIAQAGQCRRPRETCEPSTSAQAVTKLQPTPYPFLLLGDGTFAGGALAPGTGRRPAESCFRTGGDPLSTGCQIHFTNRPFPSPCPARCHQQPLEVLTFTLPVEASARHTTTRSEAATHGRRKSHRVHSCMGDGTAQTRIRSGAGGFVSLSSQPLIMAGSFGSGCPR